jgi:hypothetical protein
VHILDASEPMTTLAEIAISVIRPKRRAEDSLMLIEHIAEWMRTNPPEPAATWGARAEVELRLLL